jgi:multidrug efflux pump subunit AcrB
MGLGGAHQPFDMITMLGFLILLGTVVNNPILIVDQTKRFLEQGETVQAAVRNAVKKRLKPIFMSTATTLFGLAPLVLIPGEGTELYRGVGVIVLCGIFSSTLLSLTFLPALLMGLLKDRPA